MPIFKNKKDENIKLEKLIEVLEENFIKIKSKKLIKNGDHVLISDNLMFLYEPNEDRFSISFHISTRPDISAMFVKNIYDDITSIVCNFIVTETHFVKDDNILYGDNALQEYLKSLNNIIIDNFISNQKSRILLEDPKIGYNC